MMLILEKLLNEYGDLDNIKPYEFHRNYLFNYEFEIDSNLKVIVNFQTNFTKDELSSIGVTGIKFMSNQVFNVGFSVSGIETQAIKSSYSTLIKMMKTITDICFDFIKHNEVHGLVFYATNKDLEKMFVETDKQKSLLYMTIITKQLSKLPGWNLKKINMMSDKYSGILLYDKNK